MKPKVRVFAKAGGDSVIFKRLWQAIKLIPSWFQDDWHEVYMDGNMNHGQGREDNEKRY